MRCPDCLEEIGKSKSCECGWSQKKDREKIVFHSQSTDRVDREYGKRQLSQIKGGIENAVSKLTEEDFKTYKSCICENGLIFIERDFGNGDILNSVGRCALCDQGDNYPAFSRIDPRPHSINPKTGRYVFPIDRGDDQLAYLKW